MEEIKVEFVSEEFSACLLASPSGTIHLWYSEVIPI